MKELKIKKTTLKKLSAIEMEAIDGGLAKLSDSINTKFTDINECCDGKTCRTTTTGPVTAFTRGC